MLDEKHHIDKIYVCSKTVRKNCIKFIKSLKIYHYMKSVQIRSNFWSVFFRIRTERGRISPYSVQMRENTDQKLLRIWTLFTQCILSKFQRNYCGKIKVHLYFRFTYIHFMKTSFHEISSLVKTFLCKLFIYSKPVKSAFVKKLFPTIS